MAKVSRAHSLKKGQNVELSIDALTQGGDGIARVEGIPVFVSRTAPGDKVQARLFDVRKDFARAAIEEITTASPERVEAPCQVFDRCGGCQWQHIDYEAQLQAKRDLVRQAVKRIGGLEESLVEPVARAEHQLRYRNKAQFPVRWGKEAGELAAGYFERNSHNLVDIDECLVQPEAMDRALAVARSSCQENKIGAFDEKSHKGLLRHICIRESFNATELLVTLVVNAGGAADLSDHQLKSFRNVAQDLMSQVDEVAGVCLNFNNQRGNRILSDNTVCLAGSPVVEELLQSRRQERPEKLQKGLRFRLSSNSFFQVHTYQAVAILDEVFEAIKDLRPEDGDELRFVDVYAGVGTIASWLSQLAERVVAVEENPHAVADGRVNLLLNAITNVDFVEGRAEDAIPRLSDDYDHFDVVVLDPPRKGVSPAVLEAVMALQPRMIVYVSCSPPTLARDLKILENGVAVERDGASTNIGYKTQRVKPVDLFPQTYHIESIAVLERFYTDGSLGNLEEV